MKCTGHNVQYFHLISQSWLPGSNNYLATNLFRIESIIACIFQILLDLFVSSILDLLKLLVVYQSKGQHRYMLLQTISYIYCNKLQKVCRRSGSHLKEDDCADASLNYKFGTFIAGKHGHIDDLHGKSFFSRMSWLFIFGLMSSFNQLNSSWAYHNNELRKRSASCKSSFGIIWASKLRWKGNKSHDAQQEDMHHHCLQI